MFKDYKWFLKLIDILDLAYYFDDFVYIIFKHFYNN